MNVTISMPGNAVVQQKMQLLAAANEKKKGNWRSKRYYSILLTFGIYTKFGVIVFLTQSAIFLARTSIVGGSIATHSKASIGKSGWESMKGWLNILRTLKGRA